MPRDIAESAELKALIAGGVDSAWGWQGLFGGDPEQVLLDVLWGAHGREAEAALEAYPGVIPLGFPWEPLPTEAVPILAAHIAGIAAYESQRLDGPAEVGALSIPEPSDPSMPQTELIQWLMPSRKLGRRFF